MPLEVAIVGSGIAGLGAAIALKDHPGIRVQLYDKAKELREIGASIALGRNGMRTLDRLGVKNGLSPDIALRNKSGHPMVYRDYRTNEVVAQDTRQDEGDELHWTARYYRPDLQKALAAHVDPADIHLDKAFSSVEWDASSQKLLIKFADGSSATADILLGSDGVRSAVRTFFDPSTKAEWSGWVAFRSVFPKTHVADILKTLEDPDEAVHVWGPEGNTLFYSPLGRDLYTIVGSTQIPNSDEDKNAPYANTEWESEGNLEALRALYKGPGWGPVVHGLVDRTPNTQVYPNAAYPQVLNSWILGDQQTQKLPYGRVTVAGDAAHAHGGAHAAGGSLALDDAWAFATALKHIYPAEKASKDGPLPTDAEILKALQLYEKTRRVHTDKVIKAVHAGNEAKKERAKLGTIDTDEELLARIQNRKDTTWIHDHDVVAAFNEAVKDF